MPLNEGLYRALWLMSGSKPRVTKSGQRFRYEVEQDRYGRKRVKARAGEEYAVNCPQCGENRHRLYVHHMFGTDYPGFDTELRGPMENLCFCQNEQKCIPLRRYLGYYDPAEVTMRLASLGSSSTEDDGVFEEAPSVGTLVPLTELPPDHAVNQYLVGRGYDPAYLSRHHGVGMMTGHPDRKILGMCGGRLVFPFTVGGQVVSWQARLAYDLPKGVKFPPKWYFPPNTKKLPWNLDLASQYEVVILCEGILSAVNMGPAAISVGGKSLTYGTIQHIKSRWSKVVVAFDPDAGVARQDLDEPDYQERAIQELLEAGIQVVRGVSWEPGVRVIRDEKLDPGSLGPAGCSDLLRRSVPDLIQYLPYLGNRDACT